MDVQSLTSPFPLLTDVMRYLLQKNFTPSEFAKYACVSKAFHHLSQDYWKIFARKINIPIFNEKQAIQEIKGELLWRDALAKTVIKILKKFNNNAKSLKNANALTIMLSSGLAKITSFNKDQLSLINARSICQRELLMFKKYESICAGTDHPDATKILMKNHTGPTLCLYQLKQFSSEKQMAFIKDNLGVIKAVFGKFDDDLNKLDIKLQKDFVNIVCKAMQSLNELDFSFIHEYIKKYQHLELLGILENH